MESFSAALSARHLSTVPVRGCSHIGGHAYAGNVLVFSRGAGAVSADGSADPSAAAAAVRGDWFGYVAPEDVGGIIDGHIVRGCAFAATERGLCNLRFTRENWGCAFAFTLVCAQLPPDL